MFSSKAPPYALYSRLMRSRDRGDALWDPSPDVVLDEHGERREDPVVQVGHVGYRQEGKWRHILDIHRPRDEQLYPELIPLEGFQVLPRRFISSHDPEGPIHFTPKSRTSFAIETSCSSVGVSASGPSLRFSLDSEASLTYFGRSQRDQIRKPDVGRYKEYAVRNLRHWASLVSSNGWTLDVDELSIVTDRTLAPSWVNSVQSEKTAGAQIGAQVYVNGAASGGFSVSFQSTSTTGLVTKYGPFSRLSALPPPAESESAKFYPPRHDDPAVAGPLDQCLFIKSVRAADRSILEKSLSRLAPLVFESRKASKDPPGLSRRDYSASTSQDGSSPTSSNGFYGGSGGTPLTEDYGSDALPEVDDDDFDSYFSPEADEIYDVGKHALRYILKESGSDVAVFHDDDISPFAEELASYENASTFFETRNLHIFSYRYDGCTIGSLSELDFGTLIAHPVSYSASLSIPSHVKQELVESYPTPNYSDASTPPSNLLLHAKKEEYEDNNVWIKSSRSPWVKTERLGGDFTASISPRNVNQNSVKKEELGDVEMRSLREPPPDECSSTPSLHISSNKWLGTSTAHVSLHALPTPPPSYCEDPVPLPVKRKRGHASTWGDDSEDSNLSGDDDNRASNPPAIRNTPKRRMPGACTYCRRVKMKCEFSPGSQTCKRCYAGNHHCVVEGRKPRTAPSKREYLLAQLRQKDGIIESLLKQLHHPRTPQSADSAGSSMVADWTEGLSEDTLSWLNQPQASRSHSFPSPGDSVLPEANASSKEELVRGAWIHDYGSMHPIFPETASPLGLLANLSFGAVKRSWPGHFKKRTNPGDGFNDVPAGAASLDYFIPGPSLDLGRRISLTDKYAGPDLVVRGIVDRTEIHSLFDLFHKHINPFAGLLDPRIHTPEATYSRSPSLFTMVCTLAIRYSPRVERFALAMHQAKKLAAEALIDGWKAAELAQVYILLGMYPAPSRKVEEDRTLLYSGIAQRVISDLNLSTGTERVPRDGAEALEFANYRRLCMVSFVLEKQAAIAYGKQAVQSDAPLIDDSSDGFFSSTAANSPFDIHLVAQVAIMQKLDLFRQEIITSLKVHITPELSRRYDIKLVETSSQWIERCQHHLNQSADDASVIRCKIQQYYLASARLVVSLLILQRASPLGSQITDGDSLWRCFNIARDIIHIVTELLAPTGYLRYAPDLFFVYSAFAAATLLSLITQGRSLIDRNQSQVAYDSVNKLIATFNSTSIAIDEQHTPYIYSKLLTSLLDQCRADLDLPLEMIPQANSLNEVPSDWSSLFMSSGWILPSSPLLSSGYNVSPSMYPQTLQRDPSIPTVM